ncbi:MAG: hypothetical protein L0322_12695, partial [Chloroflexi bacterium]|nr:hypothetical protein [Chloroflexota bacterium]
AAGLAGLLTFAVYLYLPLRVWQGSDFVFGQPNTWEGFRRIFIGPRQVISVGPPSVDLEGYGSRRSIELLAALLDEVSLMGVLLGLAGLALLSWRRPERPTGLALLLTAAIAYGVGITFPIAAVASNALIPAVMALVAGSAWVVSWLAQKHPLFGWGAAAGLLALAIALAIPNWQAVHSLTHPANDGRQVLFLANQTPRPANQPEPVFMVPWGNDYFLVYFARYISHEIGGLTVVDHNANFKAYLASGRELYTLDSTFWRFPLSWWERRLDELYLAAAAPHVVQLSNQPIVRPDEAPAQSPISLGDGISLLGYRLEPAGESALRLTLYFQATYDLASDYSVTVKLTDEPIIDSPDDIVAQQDTVHPVFGWYPTSRWLPGEIVRDIYLLEWEPAGQPTRAEINLYRQSEPGVFHNLTVISIDLPIDDR